MVRPIADATDRADVSGASLAVMLSIPPDVAALFPVMRDKSMPPHVTMVYAGEVEPERIDEVVLAVADEVGYRWTQVGLDDNPTRWCDHNHLLDQDFTLGGLAYFDNDDVRVAYARVLVSGPMMELRQRLVDRLTHLGLEPGFADCWRPHATLAYLQPGEVFGGEVPKGTWKGSPIEVWYGNDLRYVIGPGSASGVDKFERVGNRWKAYRDGGRTLVGEFVSEAEAREGLLADARERSLTGRYDKLEQRGGKWAVLSEDGSEVLGEYDTENEARERLRQIEAAKAAKSDGAEQQAEFDVASDGTVTVNFKAGLITLKPDGSLRIDSTTPVRLDGQARLAPAEMAAEMAARIGRAARAFLGGQAPAVHTESRAHTFEIQRFDRLAAVELPDLQPIVHPFGWVDYPVLYSRANNIQVYDGIREFRPRKSVFDRQSMDSGIGAPWELRHSKDLLNPHTVRGVVRGVVRSVDEYHDHEHTFGWARAWDHGLMAAIEGDEYMPPQAPEVSVAYTCRVHRTPGHDDFGNPFDQWIDNILWNSLASEPRGRAETARVLGVRSDASEGITVRSADELLALAQAPRPPDRPVFVDPGSWTRFDSSRSPRPSVAPTQSRNDGDTMLKKLIPIALAAGLAEDALAQAIGLKAEDLAAFLEGETDLTPDQLNALVMAMADLPAAKPPAPAADADLPMDEPEMALVKVGDAEFSVPKVVAEHVGALEAQVEKADSRADRAGKRAEKAEADLADAEKQLAIALGDLDKRADAMKDMITRADAQKMVMDGALHIADAMELARRGFGYEWTPTRRQDADGTELPLTADDWQRAAIQAAYGDRADAVLARIDAAPTPEARAFAMQERLTDARDILDRKAHKSDETLASIEAMRAVNARADQRRLDADDQDPLAQAARLRQQYAAQPIGAPKTAQPQREV